MKTLKLLAVLSIFASSAFAQNPGFFVGAGGGLARLDVGTFTVYNPRASISVQPEGEHLDAIDRRSNVSVARLTVGYNFAENFALQLSYAAYGTGTVRVALPLYPGYEWAVGAGAPTYQRNELKYKPSALTLTPSYTYAVSEKSRVIVGAGVNYGMTSSHFEDTFIPGATISPANLVPQSHSYAEEKDNSLGFILSLGVNRLITDNLSVELTGNYSTLKAKVPSSPWGSVSKSDVTINAFGAELALLWHW
jgi:opacity protein-like surface antigen